MRTPEALLLQKLVAGSRHSIAIATPRFVADRHLRRELIRALAARRVSVRILTGCLSGPPARRSSRQLRAALLDAGARIFECPPALLNANVIVIDQLWSLAGPIDAFDLVIEDEAFAGRLLQDFDRDLAVSREIYGRERRVRPQLESLLQLARTLVRRYWPRPRGSQSSSASPASEPAP